MTNKFKAAVVCSIIWLIISVLWTVCGKPMAAIPAMCAGVWACAALNEYKKWKR